METIQKIIRLFRLYIAGFAGALALSVGVWVLCFGSGLFYACFGFGVIYLPTAINIVLFLTWPLGSALGMHFLDRRAYNLDSYHRWRVLVAFLLGVLSVIFITTTCSVGGVYNQQIVSCSFRFLIPLLLPFVIVFFSLIGYQLVGLFGGCKEPVLNKSPDVGIFSRVLPLGILMILVAVTFYLSVTRQKDEKDATSEREKANRFVEQFLASVNRETDFYKTHSSESALQSIKTNRPLIGSKYERRPHSSEKGWFEYYIIFDGTQLFLVRIDTSRNEFVMKEFRYDGTSKKMTWSDGVRLDEARKFLNKILSSIKDETAFYKEHSEETALEGIQIHRSMIRGENSLPFRSSDGRNFYFYLMFDDQQIFEAIIKDSNKDFVVSSFTYIGKGDWPEWKLHQLDLGDIDRLKNQKSAEKAVAR